LWSSVAVIKALKAQRKVLEKPIKLQKILKDKEDNILMYSKILTITREE
jgi:hypothetical protein